MISGAEQREDRVGVIPCPVAARRRHEVRVTLGPQDRFFGREAIDRFLNSPWRLTDAWDRMGVRLSGPPIPPDAALDMPSEPILRGSVQVAGDGVPSILLADHQTTGGYPKIATVLDCDINSLLQLRPRDSLRFIPVTAGEAVKIARIAELSKRAYYQAIASPRGMHHARTYHSSPIGHGGQREPGRTCSSTKGV